MALALPASLLALATRSHGLLTTADLRRAGIDSSAEQRRVRAGLLERESRCVLAVPDLRDPLTHLAAIQLRWPDAVFERRTAAAIWELDGFHDTTAIDLVCPPPTARTLTIARRARLPPKAIATRNGLRVTTPTWTLGDVAAAPDVDADLVELALESALHGRHTTEAKLNRVVEARPGPATSILGDALSRRQPGAPPTQSYAETRFLQRVVRYLGLEDPERQKPIQVKGRRTPYYRDFVFSRRGRELDVEIDGLTFHGTPQARNEDLLRDERIIAAGDTVCRFAAWRIEADRHSVCKALLRALDALDTT